MLVLFLVIMMFLCFFITYVRAPRCFRGFFAFFDRRILTPHHFLLALETFACKCVSTQQAKRVLNGNKIAVFRVYISRAKGEEKLGAVKRRKSVVFRISLQYAKKE